MEAGIATASNERSRCNLRRQLLCLPPLIKLRKEAEPNASSYGPNVEPSHVGVVLDLPPQSPRTHRRRRSALGRTIGVAPVAGSGGGGGGSGVAPARSVSSPQICRGKRAALRGRGRPPPTGSWRERAASPLGGREVASGGRGRPPLVGSLPAPPSMGRKGVVSPDPGGRGPCAYVDGLRGEREILSVVGERAREGEDRG
jgi:hypothetical protein